MDEGEDIGKIVKIDRGSEEVMDKEGGGVGIKGGRKALVDIILGRKLRLGKTERENERAGSYIGTVVGQATGRLQIQSQRNRGNRVVTDRQRENFLSLKTSPSDEITGHSDGQPHNNDNNDDHDDDNDDDGDDNDDVAVPKPGSSSRPRHSSPIPRTAFRCPKGSKGGYFADLETGCQVRR